MLAAIKLPAGIGPFASLTVVSITPAKPTTYAFGVPSRFAFPTNAGLSDTTPMSDCPATASWYSPLEFNETRSPMLAAEFNTIYSAKSAAPDVCVIPVPAVERRSEPTPMPPRSLVSPTLLMYSIKRGHVEEDVQVVPNPVRMLRRKMFVPELSVGFVFVTARTAVPVALDAAVVEPMMETWYEELANPI